MSSQGCPRPETLPTKTRSARRCSWRTDRSAYRVGKGVVENLAGRRTGSRRTAVNLLNGPEIVPPCSESLPARVSASTESVAGVLAGHTFLNNRAHVSVHPSFHEHTPVVCPAINFGCGPDLVVRPYIEPKIRLLHDTGFGFSKTISADRLRGGRTSRSVWMSVRGSPRGSDREVRPPLRLRLYLN